MTVIEELESKVLALPLAQRARLAQSLLQSFPSDAADMTEEEEMEEVERREREIQTGQSQPLSEAAFWHAIESDTERK